MTALGCVREVYGMRKISFDEAKKTVKVEYDISRLGRSRYRRAAARSRPGHILPNKAGLGQLITAHGGLAFCWPLRIRKEEI